MSCDRLLDLYICLMFELFYNYIYIYMFVYFIFCILKENKVMVLG